MPIQKTKSKSENHFLYSMAIFYEGNKVAMEIMTNRELKRQQVKTV